MKNRFTVRLSAVMLVIGINCMYSPYPCVISAGIPAMAAVQKPAVEEIVSGSAGEGALYPGADDNAAAAHRSAEACVYALGNAEAVIDGNRVDTGYIGSYEDARNVYEMSKDLYLGDVSYDMDYERLRDGNVRLFLKTTNGTPAQAYAEHLEAKAYLSEIADSLLTDDEEQGEIADRVFQWVKGHVTYAYNDTDCNPTAYNAVMDGTATCDGLSTMLLALLDKCGVPAAKVQNGQHAYTVAWSNGQWVLYDAASGLSGDPSEFMERYGDCYAPETVTLDRVAAGTGTRVCS